MTTTTVNRNPSYRFISDNAQAASRKFGVKSVSLVADMPASRQPTRRDDVG